MSGANFIGAGFNSDIDNLRRTSFCNANLCGAQMTGVFIIGTDFTGCQFNGNEAFTLGLPDWKKAQREGYLANELDRCLNHITNQSSGSILTAIESIDNQYNELKLKLMHQLIDSLEGIDTSSVGDAFLDIWLKNPLYYNDAKIRSYVITNKLLMGTAMSRLDLEDESKLRLLLEMVNGIGNGLEKTEKNAQRKNFMLNNNAFFVQLLAKCVCHANAEIKDQAAALYWEYMNLEELKRYQKDTYVESLEDAKTLDTYAPAFVFFAEDEAGNTNALFVSQEMINSMLKPDPHYEWSNVISFRNGQCVENKNIADLEKVYEPFPLFLANYQYQRRIACFPKMLDAINLDFTNPKNTEGTKAKNYTDLFADAINSKASQTKLISVEHQLALNEIFAPLLQVNDGVVTDITDAHWQQISRIFEVERQGPPIQAQTLICLAAVFITYSSAYYFGTESESPNALRNYAVGLLKRAHNRDASVFNNNEQASQFNDWIARLTGTGKAFQCTAVLKGMVFEHAKNRGFGNILGKIKPPAW